MSDEAAGPETRDPGNTAYWSVWFVGTTAIVVACMVVLVTTDSWLITLGLLVGTSLLATAWHELGHVVASLLRRMEVHGVVVRPWILYRNQGRWKVSWVGLLYPYCGGMFVCPSTVTGAIESQRISALSGILASVLLGDLD